VKAKDVIEFELAGRELVQIDRRRVIGIRMEEPLGDLSAPWTLSCLLEFAGGTWIVVGRDQRRDVLVAAMDRLLERED
jgi:hypothetical protein